jgi:hypothetical protein
MGKFNANKDLNFLKEITLNATKGIAKYPVISECPVCHHDLEVKKLACSHCETELSGRFTLSKFNYLDTEKLYFIEVFVKNRGNIKMVEKEMGLSYPTIKKMLDDAIEGLGYSSKDEPVEPKEEYNGPSRKEILDQVQNGEISAEEAAKLLAKIK